jgi:hypothetical protein
MILKYHGRSLRRLYTRVASLSYPYRLCSTALNASFFHRYPTSEITPKFANPYHPQGYIPYRCLIYGP